jgi:cholesterol transport system auxiliary component
MYVLAAAPATDAPATASTVDLAISQAVTTPGLDSERIAVIHGARRLEYYLDAQWGAPLPQVVQAMVVGSLQNQKWFRSVTSEQARVSTNYWLELEVRDFQAEYASEGATPTVRVTLVGSLIRIKDRKLIGVLPATVTVTPTEHKLGAVVAAFESAAQQASVSLGRQTVAAIGAIKAE